MPNAGPDLSSPTALAPASATAAKTSPRVEARIGERARNGAGEEAGHHRPHRVELCPRPREFGSDSTACWRSSVKRERITEALRCCQQPSAGLVMAPGPGLPQLGR